MTRSEKGFADALLKVPTSLWKSKNLGLKPWSTFCSKMQLHMFNDEMLSTFKKKAFATACNSRKYALVHGW